MSASSLSDLIRARGLQRIALLTALLSVTFAAELGAQNRPVVFVHGFAEGPGTWGRLKPAVAASFRAETLSPGLSWGSRYQVQNGQLHSALGTRRNAIAVSHSNGSIVTRTYLQRFGSGSKITQHVSIGGLHRGAQLAESLVNGSFEWWMGGVAYQIASTFRFFLNFDPQQSRSYEFGRAMSRAEDLVFLLFNVSSPLAMDKLAARALGFGLGLGVPALQEMRPQSPIFGGLGGINGFAFATERRITGTKGRVSIATLTNGAALPWTTFRDLAFPPDWVVNAFYVSNIVVKHFALGMYFYYAFHSDPLLRANAWRWLDTYYVMATIPWFYHYFIGAVGSYGRPLPNDGILPWSTQDYHQATRLIRLTANDIGHIRQTSHGDVHRAVLNVLRVDFNLPLRRTNRPPRPPRSPCRTPSCDERLF